MNKILKYILKRLSEGWEIKLTYDAGKLKDVSIWCGDLHEVVSFVNYNTLQDMQFIDAWNRITDAGRAYAGIPCSTDSQLVIGFDESNAKKPEIGAGESSGEVL